MSMREIPAGQWPEFLDQFSRDHRAWLATIDRARAGSPAQIEVSEQPLAGVVPQVTAQGIQEIDIELQPDGVASGPIRILGPKRVRVDENAAGIAQAVEIDNDRGECTRIRFRSAPPADMLDGIAPGELPPTSP